MPLLEALGGKAMSKKSPLGSFKPLPECRDAFNRMLSAVVIILLLMFVGLVLIERGQYILGPIIAIGGILALSGWLTGYIRCLNRYAKKHNSGS